MKQEAACLGSKASIYFTPHLLPVTRGIITTAHILFEEHVSFDEIRRRYDAFYKNEPFIRFQIAKLGGVHGSNFCDINFELGADGMRFVTISAIDNLIKGVEGQAIQNMNIMCGYTEIDGLQVPGMFP
jgi:N-acetyl-gamma-glutamyl-phosphate reductase